MNPKTKKLLWAIAIGLVLANIGTLVLVAMLNSKVSAPDVPAVERTTAADGNGDK